MKKLSIVLVALAVAWPLLAATRTAAFEVTGWTCGSCASATRIALKKLDGVEDVRTDHEKKEVLVTYDDSQVTTDRLVQAIAKLGYKATVKATPASSASSPGPQAGKPADAPVFSERVSFFEVPLECGAAERLGCGSASKPVLKALERDPRVKEAKINHAGTVLAVVWNEPEASSAASTVEAAFKTRDLEATLLRGPARDRALKEYGFDRWYGSAEVDRLSEREAQVIAARLVNRAKARLELAPERLEALTNDLSGGIAAILTRDKGEVCARDPFEELTKIAGKHLNQRQLAELLKAAEQGAGALPGETR